MSTRPSRPQPTHSPSGRRWRSAAEAVRTGTGLDIAVHEIGTAGLADPDGNWLEQTALPAGGALLVRPDQHVAARSDQGLRPGTLAAHSRTWSPPPFRVVTIGNQENHYKGQDVLLRALHDHPDASASELARLCFVTRQSLRDVLTGLRTAGLVGPSSAQRRGRANALQLTPDGLLCLKSSHAAVEGIEREMLQGISSSGQVRMSRSRTTRSASLPASIEPTWSSRKSK